MKSALWATALALVATSACAGRQPSPAGEPTLADIEQLTSLVRQPRSRALLVVFWATWCEPCVAEIPDLVALHTTMSENLEIVGVSLDAFLNPPEKSLELVREQLRLTPTPYAHLVYTGRQDPLFALFDMPGGIPYAVLYDRNGAALERFSGQVRVHSVRAALALEEIEG